MTLPTHIFLGSKEDYANIENKKFVDLFDKDNTYITEINDYGHLDY